MAKAEAFCVEAGRNVTIVGAREFYFSQREPRKKLTFLCGDPRCRAILKPEVIGENYYKTENSPDKRKSPCFRENIYRQHIANCTWINNDATSSTKAATHHHNAGAGQACADLGLIFRPYPRQRNGGSTGDRGTAGPATLNLEPSRHDGSSRAGGATAKRPETNRFMSTVAMLHLQFTDEQKRNTRLSIENYADGTFYSICLPIKGFHPHFQTQRIYFGRCEVDSLTNVFMIRLRGRISPIGDRDKRNVSPEISMSKSRLKNENADLMQELESLAKSKDEAYCHFFSITPPNTIARSSNKTGSPVWTVARFSIDNLDHVAVIPLSELTEPDLADRDD